MLAIYLYAVLYLPIKSIEHKFLICGHTQNEGDGAHSVIEKAMKRAKRSGNIYTPEQIIAIIRTAKKVGKPFEVIEMNYSDFYDLKSLFQDMRINITKNVKGEPFKITEVKVMKFEKDLDSFFYKTDYEEIEWQEVKFIKRLKKGETARSDNVELKKAYSKPLPIEGKKELICTTYCM